MAQQQYSYGYGYGYGYGTPTGYMGAHAQRPAMPQAPIAAAVGLPQTPTATAVGVPQAPTVAAIGVPQAPTAAAVGYSPYQQQAATMYQQQQQQATQPVRAPAPQPVKPTTPVLPTPPVNQQTPFYQQTPQAVGSYYGYQAAASSYASYYQQAAAAFSTPTPRPAPAPAVKYPPYTPSPITQGQQPRPPAVATPSLVSYPSVPNNPPVIKPTVMPVQQQQPPQGAQNFTAPQPAVSENLTPQQKQVVAQYVQHKTQPATPTTNKTQWWNKKPSYGTGKEFYCEVCRVSAVSAGTYKTHLEGKLHKKKLAQQKQINMEDKKACEFYCELCDVVCSNGDSLEAHNKGIKHQKVLNLHRRLGKPIPTLKLVDSAAGDGKKVLAGPKIMFVGGSTLHSTDKQDGNEKQEVKVYPPNAVMPTQKIKFASDKGNKEQQEEAVPEKEVEPVGEHLVKAVKGDPKFPHAQYKCEMCDCYFNDDYAKKAHVKGRRHRLNYKKMYQPDLYVEPTSTQRKEMEKRKKQREAQMSHRGQKGRGVFSGGEEPMEATNEETEDDGWDGGWDASMNPDPYHDPHDDILVMDKHKLVYPPRAEVKAVEKVVTDIEKALKTISDELMKERAATVNGDEKDEAFRDLKGVMRVGAFAHNLLLKGECSVELVLMCDIKPTMALFNLVINRLALRFESLLRNSDSENVYNTTPIPDKAMVTIISQVGSYRVIVSVVFSSTLMRQEPSALQLQADQSEGVLDRQYCVAALAALRHTKWFKALSKETPASGVVLRVMKDICRRVPAWGVLESWMLELLVQKCALSSHPAYRQPGDLFRRVIECVASGIFLPGGHGLLDPCEKDPVDACAPLTAADRSNLTLSAQHALRLIAFRKLHLVLGVDPLPGDVPNSEGEETNGDSKEGEGVAEGTGVKRSPPDGQAAGEAVKKVKTEQ